MWAKVDDKLHAHPKFAALPMSARGLWVTAMSWCADYLTDGELPERMVLAFGARRRDADRLVEAGLWEVTGTGFRFHDWGAYQPSARDAAKVRAEISEKRARSGAKGGRSKAANRAKSSSKPSSKCVANVKQMCSPEPEPHSVPTVRGDGAPAPVQETLTGEAIEPPADNAGTLVAEWIDHCKVRPPGNIVGQTSKQLRMLLDDGLTADQIRPGLAAWQRKGAHPTALPSFVNQELNSTPASRSGGPDWDRWMAEARAADEADRRHQWTENTQ